MPLSPSWALLGTQWLDCELFCQNPPPYVSTAHRPLSHARRAQSSCVAKPRADARRSAMVGATLLSVSAVEAHRAEAHAWKW